MGSRRTALLISSTCWIGFIPLKVRGRPWGGFLGALAGAVLLLLLLQAKFPASWISISAILTGWMGTLAIGPAEALLLRWRGPRMRHNGKMADHDFNETNIDEVHGQLIAGLPLCWVADPAWQAWGVLIAFVLFRITDAGKVWPVNVVERRVPGPLGIMLDDTVAGLLAAAALIPLAIWR